MVIVLSVLVFIIINQSKGLSNNNQFDNDSSDSVYTPQDITNENRLLTLVNSDNPLSEDFILNLIEINNIPVDASLEQSLNNMFNDAYQEGLSLIITKGYVDKDTQQSLHDSKVSQLINSGLSKVRAEEQATRCEPKGNYSDLQTGLSVELSSKSTADNQTDFTSSAEYRWLINNCVQYGFVLRFPANKENVTKSDFNPYRFRFVGLENAKKMRILDMCLEEYFNYISVQNDS